jgi:hypothetical protein
MTNSLEARVQALEDIHQIQNMMSRYEYFHTVGMHKEVLNMFASKTPGVAVEIPHLGRYEGLVGIRRFWIGANFQTDTKREGIMIMHTLTTPVIEVAGDGKTAKAVWISPGHETGPFGGEPGKVNAVWSWNKYGVDFVKEDGVWKFWHFHLYRIFKTPYDKSWVEAPYQRPPAQTDPDKRPDKPSTYDWVYSPAVETENIPEPPAPYETWDPAKSYIK